MTETTIPDLKFETAPDDEIPDTPKATVGETLRTRVGRSGKNRETGSKKAVTNPPASHAKKLCEPLPDLYRFVGMSIAAVDPHCGMAIVENAEMLGDSWLKLAETSPAFRRYLQKLTQAGGVGTVIAAHLPLAALVFAHHGPGSREKDTETNGDDA